MAVKPSEWDRRALAAVNPKRKIGKRKKLSSRKDVQDLNKEMDSASCGLQCQTAHVPTEDLKLNEECMMSYFRISYHGITSIKSN